MKIKTTVLGEIEYDLKSIISFEEGLIGLEDKKKFILLEKDDFKPFSYLQSVDDGSLSLIVINPLLIRKNYIFKVHEDDFKTIDVEDVDDFSLYSIVVFSEDIKNMTVNLKAPILINIHSKKARQVILINDNYRVAEPLLESSTLASYFQEKNKLTKESC